MVKKIVYSLFNTCTNKALISIRFSKLIDMARRFIVTKRISVDPVVTYITFTVKTGKRKLVYFSSK